MKKQKQLNKKKAQKRKLKRTVDRIKVVNNLSLNFNLKLIIFLLTMMDRSAPRLLECESNLVNLYSLKIIEDIQMFLLNMSFISLVDMSEWKLYGLNLSLNYNTP